MFGVKETDKCVNKTFRLPESLLAKLDSVAKQNGISVNNLVRQMAEYALADMEPLKKQ